MKYLECLHCGTELLGRHQKKFCSSSCSAKYNNNGKTRSDESKSKTSKSLKEFYKKNPTPPKPKKMLQIICENCQSSFFHTSMKKTCSNSCYKSIQKKHGQKGGKKSANIQTIRSKDEILLYKLCKNYFNNVSHNEIIIDGWDADIILTDYKVAILWNGPWHYRKMPGLKHSLPQVQNRDKIKIDLFNQHGWKTYIFEDNNYSPNEAFNKLVADLGGDPSTTAV